MKPKLKGKLPAIVAITLVALLLVAMGLVQNHRKGQQAQAMVSVEAPAAKSMANAPLVGYVTTPRRATVIAGDESREYRPEEVLGVSHIPDREWNVVVRSHITGEVKDTGWKKMPSLDAYGRFNWLAGTVSAKFRSMESGLEIALAEPTR